MSKKSLPAGQALELASLVSFPESGITSRILAKTKGGNVTLFAFDAGEEISEHSAPFDALVFVLEGAITLTIGGQRVDATPGTVVLMPADIPHAVKATKAAKMMLTMLREPKG